MLDCGSKNFISYYITITINFKVKSEINQKETRLLSSKHSAAHGHRVDSYQGRAGLCWHVPEHISHLHHRQGRLAAHAVQHPFGR
jgi:hypothetical protein